MRFTSRAALLIVFTTLIAACSPSDGSSNRSTTSSPSATAASAGSTTTSEPTPTTEAATTSTATTSTTDVVEEIQRLLDADAALVPSSPGELLTVRAPSLGIDETFATGAPAANDTFRIASITKTFTAATGFRLIEDGKLALDTSIEAAGTPAAILEALSGDGYQVDVITVGQLLTHTSGIADYADNDAGAGSGPYSAAILADPSHVWTPLEQVRFAVDNHEPLSAPGAEFHYSDTGYVILGQIIEAITGSTYAEAMRSLLRFDRLGMTSTYLESAEPTPSGAGPWATQLLGTLDISTISPTADLYGGGGLVSSTADLATFFRALGRGEVFAQPDTFDLMTRTVAPGTDGAAAAGVYRTALGGTPCWFHEGFWGTEALTCPALDLTITRSYQQADPDPDWDSGQLLTSIITLLGLDDRSPAAGADATTSETLLSHPIELSDEPCIVGFNAAARCGIAKVPLDWTDPDGETIDVWWGLQQASTQPSAGVLIPLLGGPGGAISTGIDSFTSLATGLPDRDVLFVDVRGVGRSSRLSCPAIDRSELIFGTELRSSNATCASQLGERRNSFTTVATVLDIEAIRRALGLGSPSLLAFSYGTFLATTYTVLMPDIVTAAVLDGAFPLSTDRWAIDVARSIPRVARLLCDRSQRCDGEELLKQIEHVAADLRERPHAFTGVEQPFTEGVFVSLTQAAIAAGSQAYLDGVSAAAGGDYSLLEPLVTALVTGGGQPVDPSGDSFSLGTTVWCNDYVYPYDLADTPAQREAALDEAVARLPDDAFAPFSKSGWLDASLDHPDECVGWPTPNIPTTLRVPRFGPFPEVPVVVINGDIDLQTPIASARIAADQFPNSVFVEVPNGPHAVIPESPCILSMAVQFLATQVLPPSNSCADEPLPSASS